MKHLVISSILQQNWAISEKAAASYGPIIYNVLTGKMGMDVDDSEYTPYLIVGSAQKGQRAFVANEWNMENAPVGSVAIIPISGPLMKDDQWCGPAGMATMGEMIKQADANENIDAIILKIDSPGGTVDGTINLAEIIKGTEKPIVAHIDGMMASAAYWIGSATDEIIASNDMDEIGSIGVLLHFADMQPAWEKLGVKFHEIYADQSKDKNKLIKEVLEGNYDNYKEEVLNPLAAEFISAVKENRGDKINEANGKVYTGKVYFAKDAIINGLIDKIGNFDAAVDRAYELSAEINNKKNTAMSKTEKNDKKYSALTTALGIEAFEITEEGIFLSEEQLETLNTAMETVNTKIADAGTKEQEHIDAITVIDEKLDAIDETVAEAETTDDKIEAVVAVVTGLKDESAADKTQVETDKDHDGEAKPVDKEASEMYELSKAVVR